MIIKLLKQMKWTTIPLVFAVSMATAHDNAVVPQAEYEKAQQLLASGPKQTSGISKADVLGTFPLDGEFTTSDGLVLRARELVIEVGGIIAVHQHKNRTGVAYLIEGEMTEHRSSEKDPIVKKAGDTAFEKTGLIHWWENTGTIPARAIIVDIIPAEK